MTEDSSVNPLDTLKTAYLGLLDQTVELARIPIESAKKLLIPAIDAQKQSWDSISKEQNFSPIRDIVSASAGYFGYASKQLSEGLEVAKKSAETWTEIALAWQKVALEAQGNAFNAYKTWFGRFKA